MDNVVPFPIKKKDSEETQNEMYFEVDVENDEFIFTPAIDLDLLPDNREDFLIYMREVLTEEDYIDLLEGILLPSIFDILHEDLQIIANHYLLLEK